jgi:hypothetical protein
MISIAHAVVSKMGPFLEREMDMRKEFEVVKMLCPG